MNLLERITAAGFTLSALGMPPTLTVVPANQLTDKQRATIRDNLDSLLLDTLWPPISDADQAWITALLQAGRAREEIF